MTSGGTPAGVVVGFGGDGTTEEMLDWAAAEAATRGCPLRLLHVMPPPPPTDPYGFLVTDVEAMVGLRTDAERRLRQALSRARAVAPDIDVTARLVQGSVVPILVDRARGAAMLVLGRGLRDERGLLRRSVSARVGSRAGCPVVVVGPSPAPASGSPPRVVVGIDSAASCTGAVGFAFGAARQRGIPLVAVQAWTPEPPADLESIAVPTAMAEIAGPQNPRRGIGALATPPTAMYRSTPPSCAAIRRACSMRSPVAPHCSSSELEVEEPCSEPCSARSARPSWIGPTARWRSSIEAFR